VVVDDAESLAKLPDEAFDVVFSFSTVRFCPNPQAALNSIHRKLRPGGVAIVDFPNLYSPWHGGIKRLLGIALHVHDTLYTKAQAVRLFTNAKFRVEGVKQFLFTTKRLPAVLLPLSKAVDFTFERLGPLCHFAGIIMVKGVKD
jgi:SAM-dependent methyltransferase